MPSQEPTLRDDSDLPDGYKFIRAGNMYITKNCRAFSHEAGRTVYVIRNSKKGICGIGVPTQIWKLVRRLNDETREQRKDAVKKKDSVLNNKVKAELLKKFPRIPEERIEPILQHMLKKKSRRVGRSKDVSTQQMAILGVVAHIRHKLTDYDQLLGEGMSKEQARLQVKHMIDEVVRTWGFTSSDERKPTKSHTIAVRSREKAAIRPARRSSLRLKATRKHIKKTKDASSGSKRPD